MRAPAKGAVRFDEVADNPAIPVRARGCKQIDGALEAVESVRDAARPHVQRLIAVVLLSGNAIDHLDRCGAQGVEQGCR